MNVLASAQPTDFANIGWMYLLYALVVGIVVVESLYYIIMSIKRAKKINMDMVKIKKIISSSIIFSILPSVGIFIGVIVLAQALGIPLPAIRLSIVGSLQYETMAADWVSGQIDAAYAGLKDLVAAGGVNPQVLITFAFAMTFGIIWGPLFCIFFYKKMQPKLMTIAKKSGGNNDYIFAAVFIGMVLAYVSVACGEIVRSVTSIVSYYSFISIIVSAGVMWLCDTIIKKGNQKWLENFSLAFSMLSGMAVVGVINVLV